MIQFSRALAGKRHESWTPKSVAEAEKSSVRIAEGAGLSRQRPIPDGPDQWEMYRSSTATGLGASASLVPGLVAGSGSTGTCVT
jgi:hypothetical protein